jgi:transposase-like protein
MSTTIKQLAQKLVKENKFEGLRDVEDLLGTMMKEMVQEVLKAEMSNHLGYEKHERSDSENFRNGHSKKTLKTSVGALEIEVPRDRKSEFKPQLVKNRETLGESIEEKIIAMYGRGMSTRDINAHLEEIYGIEVSADMVSDITDKIMPFVQEWQNRQLDNCYPVVFFDGIHYSIRKENRVTKACVYLCLAINSNGMKDILGMWVGEGAEGAKFWLTICNELKNRGVEDILIACMDGLKGLPDAVRTVFPKVDIQQCIIHQIRNSTRYVSWKDMKALCADLKSVYQAPSEKAGYEALQVFREKWDQKYSAVGKSWEENWANLSTFFAYPEAVRRAIYTTNALENVNRQLRKVTKTKSVFPNDKAVEKALYLAIQNLSKKWTMQIQNWREIAGQFSIVFGERFTGN